jgi:beta-N-acetylhexosaminidase
VTSVNTLSRPEWQRLSGFPFRQAIDAGVWSLMVGHIALPAWDDTQHTCGVHRPASISPTLVTGLLRGELGFQGLIVTDDMNMGGVAGYAKRRDRTVACIAAGCDMLLFPKLPDDYATLLDAVRSGTLPEARVNDAVRRILAFKARLHLHTGELFGPAVDIQEQQTFAEASRQIAAAAIVKVRDHHGTLPIQHLKPGAKVLTITLASDFQDVPEVDSALRARGYHVDHAYNPDDLRLSDQTFAYELCLQGGLGTAVGSLCGPPQSPLYRWLLQRPSLRRLYLVRVTVSPADVQYPTELPQRALLQPG